MAQFKTGRQRTITLQGTFSIPTPYYYGKLSPHPAASEGVQAWGAGSILAELGFELMTVSARAGYRPPTGPYPPATFWLGVEISCSLFGSEWDGAANTMAGGGSGTWTASFPVEEFLEIETFGDFPNGQPDGLYRTHATYFEKMRVGETALVTISFGGLTASCSTAVPFAHVMPIQASVLAHSIAGCGSYTCCGGPGELGNRVHHFITWPYGSYSAEMERKFEFAPGDKYEFGVDKGEVYAYAYNSRDAGAYIGWVESLCSAVVGPDIPYGLNGRCRLVSGNAYPNNLRLQLAHRQSELTYVNQFGGTWAYQWPQRTTIAGGSAQIWAGVAHQYELRQDFTIGSVNEVAHVSAALDPETTRTLKEDIRDRRTQFHLWPYPALQIEQADTLAVSASKTLTASNASIPLTQSDLTGFRYLNFTATPTGYGARTHTITVGEKTYSFTVGSAGVPTSVTLDLCLGVTNLPVGFVADARGTRFPIAADGTTGYFPTAAPTLWQGSDELKGWLWGIIQEPTSVAVAGLTGAETLAISAMSLKKVVSREVRMLQPFQSEVHGWTSPTDNTYLDPDLGLYCDGKQIGPFPCRAHIVPTTGAPESYRYFSISELASMVSAIPGWTGTALTAPTYCSIGPNSAAGYIPPYVYNGDSGWVDQTSKSPTVSLIATQLADGVRAYPGCGDPHKDYGPTNVVFPLRNAKVLRGQAEGLAGHQSGAAYIGLAISAWDSVGLFAGVGVTNAIGWYRTGTPNGRGNRQHVTQVVFPDFAHPTGVLNWWQNREAVRTSFKMASVLCAGTPPRLPVDCATLSGALPFSTETCDGTVVDCSCGQVKVRRLPSPGGRS